MKKPKERKGQLSGSSHYTKNEDKKYGFTSKHLNGLNIEDIIELLGPEAGCNLLKFYGGVTIYIPQKKTIRNRIECARIREEFEDLTEEGLTQKAIVKHLSEKYNVHTNTIRYRLGKWFLGSLKDMDRKQRETRYKVNVEMDKKLVELVSENYQIFKSHGII